MIGRTERYTFVRLYSHRVILVDHRITPPSPIRFYCNTTRRLRFVYTFLRDLGYEDVGFYKGGIDAWAAYGGQLVTTPPKETDP